MHHTCIGTCCALRSDRLNGHLRQGLAAVRATEMNEGHAPPVKTSQQERVRVVHGTEGEPCPRREQTAVLTER